MLFLIVFSLRYPNLALFPWCTHCTPRKTCPAPFSVLFLAFGGVGGCGQRGAISRAKGGNETQQINPHHRVVCQHVPSLAKKSLLLWGNLLYVLPKFFLPARDRLQNRAWLDLTGCETPYDMLQSLHTVGKG
jgi:hypothetical protein